AFFDGTHLYEHADPRKGFHPDWASLIFNYGRHEVRSFLLSSARFWLDRYHADRLRVDAVASMLSLDYSRKAGEWVPNVYGGRENLEAISLLRRLNEMVYSNFPGAQTIAEESTSCPLVLRAKHPTPRKSPHNPPPFRMLYAFSETFILPLSHDEVVHGKLSLIGK